MDIDDDMECKSAASWNPKFDFEPGGGTAKGSPDLSKLSGISTFGPRMSSARHDISGGTMSDLGSPDSRVSVSRRTPALSDMDAMSIQLDAYDDIVEDHLTPQPSVSESAADESTTRSGLSPVRLPNFLPDLDEDSGAPSHSDALSRWLMGSMYRSGSVAESESPTRPSTRPGHKSKTIHVTIDDGSLTDGTEGRPTSAITDLAHSKMLGHRMKRPHTAPTGSSSFEDLQEAFDEALLRFQGDTDINKLFKNYLGSYDENWQEKLIERHKLLSMQKEIRVKSSVHRRQAIHQQLMDKRHSLLGHRHCDGVIDPADEPTRAQSARLRINTAVSKPLISVSLNNARLKSGKSNKEQDATTSPLVEKANLINESQVQYRFRINESSCQQLHSTLKPATPLSSERVPDSVTYDPRRPQSVRRPGTRSIPSRCTRFVLVRQKKSSDRPTSPSPLEKQLLSKRFPSYASRVIPGYANTQGASPVRNCRIGPEQKITVPT